MSATTPAERIGSPASIGHIIWRAWILSPVLVLLLGALAIRMVLMPLWEGRDFHAYAILVGQYTLHSRNVYDLDRLYLRSHHMLGWTYFPLCLDMYSALYWLSLHMSWSFRLLGKILVVAADLCVGWLLYVALHRRGHSERLAATGMVLYLFNPLVLYNGAYYGRFDAIALAFVLLAIELYHTLWFSLAFGLAIAAKTFPAFLIPPFAFGRDRQQPHRLIFTGVLVLLLALPYILVNPRGLANALLSNTDPHMSYRGLGRLSWYSLLWYQHWLSLNQILALTHVTLLLYPIILLTVLYRPVYVKVAVCFTLFLLLNRSVYEQYLLWPLPFLIVVGLHYRNRLALALAAFYTVAGMLENELTWTRQTYLPPGLLPTPWLGLNVALAGSALIFIGNEVWRQWVRPGSSLHQGLTMRRVGD